MATESITTQGTEIIGLLLEQRSLYQRLQALSDRQRAFIIGNEPERLLAVLAERQELIDLLQGTAQRLRPYHANWRQLRAQMSEERGNQADALVSEVNNLLSSILAQDEADSALLSARKTETGRKIGTVQAGQQASRAYAGSYGPAGGGAEWT